MSKLFTWARRHPNGYECSSKGDKRFSALYAKMPDGRTLKMWYQCDVKGYGPDGTNWKLGKGKPALIFDESVELYPHYLALWEIWAKDNIHLLRELYKASKEHKILTDCFATSTVNQAREFAKRCFT